MSSLLAAFLQQSPVFRRDQLLGYLNERLGKRQAARRLRGLLGYQIKRGAVECLRHGLYATCHPRGYRPNPYLIAGMAAEDAVIGFQAALAWHLHGSKRPPTDLHVYATGLRADRSGTRQKPHFVPVKARHAPRLGAGEPEGVQVVTIHGCSIRITTVERTIIDVLDRPDLSRSLRAAWIALNKLEGSLDLSWMASYLRKLDCASTTAKVGYFLSGNLKRFDLQAKDLQKLPESPATPHPWVKGLGGKPHPVWNLIVPQETQLPEAEAFTLGSLFGVPAPTSGGRLREHQDAKQIDLLGELSKRFGEKYTYFRKGQEPIIRAVLEGRDALAILPTGSGKSLTYQFPAMLLDGVTLVVSPLLALMEDQVREARSRRLHAVALKALSQRGKPHRKNSGARSSHARPDVWASHKEVARRLSRGRLDLLFVSPEGLEGLATLVPQLRRVVKQVVVDEAHLIHTWGREFREPYRNLHVLRSLFPGIPVLALTATATDSIRARILEVLGMVEGQFEDQRVSVARLNLHIDRKEIEDGTFESRFNALRDFLIGRYGEAGIVYCTTRPETEAVAARLQEVTDKPVRFYHAGLTDAKRRATQNAFIVRKSCKLMVATVAFGLGINKADIRWIVHFGLPSSLEGYVQEVGRAGRDGARSDCLLIHSSMDEVIWKKRFKVDTKELEPRPDLLTMELKQQVISARELKDMVRFSRARRCLHQFIGKHFSDKQRPCIDQCDVCDETVWAGEPPALPPMDGLESPPDRKAEEHLGEQMQDPWEAEGDEGLYSSEVSAEDSSTWTEDES